MRDLSDLLRAPLAAEHVDAARAAVSEVVAHAPGHEPGGVMAKVAEIMRERSAAVAADRGRRLAGVRHLAELAGSGGAHHLVDLMEVGRAAALAHS